MKNAGQNIKSLFLPLATFRFLRKLSIVGAEMRLRLRGHFVSLIVLAIILASPCCRSSVTSPAKDEKLVIASFIGPLSAPKGQE